VEPSISVKRNVTIPEGKAVVIGTPQTPDPLEMSS
jgi:hypothetical protein